MCYTFKEVLISRLHEESKQLNINKINNQNKKWENNFSSKNKNGIQISKKLPLRGQHS